MDTKTLTPRQSATLDVISAHQVARPTGPTIRAVAEQMGLAPNAVQRHVDALRAAGFVEHDAGLGLVIVARATTRKPIAKPGGKLL